MSWARLDDQIAFHPKIMVAGNDAFGAWVRMLAYCCAQLTDGDVTERVALTIASRKTVARLIRVRLLDVIDGGYHIHDFHHWNPPAETVRAKRELDRARKAVGRANQGRSANGRVSGGSPSAVRADVHQDNGRNPQRRPPVPSPSPLTEIKPVISMPTSVLRRAREAQTPANAVENGAVCTEMTRK